MLVLILIVSVAAWMLTKEKYQNMLAIKGARYLSEKLKTKVEVNHVSLGFFNRFNFEGVYIEDQKHDTLAYVGTLQLKTSELLSNYLKGSKAVIHDVALEDVFVHLNRVKDSTWNYDFISDAFASSDKDTMLAPVETSPTEKKSASNPEIDLKNVKLSRVRFFMDDAWRGEDMDFQIASLKLSADDIDLLHKNIALKEIEIDGADISVREYDKLKPEDNSPDDTTDWGTPFNPDLFKLTLPSLTLTNSHVSYLVDQPESNAHEFDENNINVTQLNLSLRNTKIIADTIFSSVESMTAQERCGIAIKSLKANLKLSQVQAVLDQMRLETNNSILSDHYEMNYKNFHDFNDYIAKVNMKAHMVSTSISSLDIGYFANILNEYPISVNLSGDIDGTVDHIGGKNINLQTRNTSFKGDAIVTGLPDIKTTMLDVTNINLATNGKDLNILIPQTRTNNVAWNELQKINYTGSWKGNVDKFYTKGNLSTSMGNATLDLNMNFQPDQPTYDGHIETENFDIGKLIRQSTLGKVSMKGKIDGSGFDLDHLKANIDATISKIEVDNTLYTELTVNGIVARKKFDGIFISQDPNLAVNFNGKLDLSGAQPVYNFNSRFIRFDLKKLGLTNESIIGSGYASLNFEGSTIDNFTGSALLKNIVLETNGKVIRLNDVLLESYQSSVEKTLRLSSSIADAEMKGHFNISGLPNAIQLYLYHYLPEYIKKPENVSNQELTFTINLKETDSILHTFLPEYRGLSGSAISGNLNTMSQKFALDANILSFGYRQFEIQDLIIVGAGDYTELDLNATSGNLLYNEEVMIPSFQVNALMASDTASLSIITQSINEVLGDAYLSVKGTARNNNLYVNLLPSNITIKEDKWQLYSNHELVFGEQVSINELVFESGAQKITASTKNSTSNDLSIDLSELDLQSFSAYLDLQQNNYYGRISGHIDVDHFLTDQFIRADVHSTNEVRINKDTLGMVHAVVNFDTKTRLLTIDKNTSILRGTDYANASGYVNLNDSTIKLQTVLMNTNIAFANQFVIDFIQDLSGRASGTVTIEGPLYDPKIAGDIVVSNASMKVIYLGTRYTMDQVKLHFNNRKIDVEDFYLSDERSGNYSALVKGYITHRNFNDIRLNLNVTSSNLLCLNTMEWDNDLFYGYVPAEFSATASGALDDMTLDITAKPLKGSTFHMPISSSGDASKYDYIEFVEIGKDQYELSKKKSSNYFKINMHIDATPDAEIFIILDKNTGEEIQAKGNGNISLSLDMGNSMNMFGTYTITEGKYNFNFRGVLQRQFIIDEGSKIVWNGDPVDANVDVNAIYKLPNNLSLLPLVGNIDDPNELEEAKKKYETFIYLTLKNKLANPDIKFDIAQPSNKAIGTLAYDRLVQIRNDDKELVSQAGVLLLLGEFKGTTGLAESGSYERAGLTTASDVISNALSSGLTNVFSSVTGLNNFTLNIGYKQYSLNETQANINQFNFGISASLFKDRVIVDFGSNVDVDRNTAATKGTSTVNIAGDFKAQYLVTEDGRLRVNAYRTSNYNAEGNNYMKGGVGISYKKVFNKVVDFFTSKKKKFKQKTSDTLTNSNS